MTNEIQKIKDMAWEIKKIKGTILGWDSNVSVDSRIIDALELVEKNTNLKQAYDYLADATSFADTGLSSPSYSAYKEGYQKNLELIAEVYALITVKKSRWGSVEQVTLNV